MRKNNIILAFAFLIIIFIYMTLLYFDVRVATDFPYIFAEELIEWLPQSWTTVSAAGFGENGLLTLWNWPLRLLFTLFYSLGGNYVFLIRFVAIFPAIIFGFLGIYKLLSLYGLSNSLKAISGIFYVTTTYFILLIDGGQLSIALAYSIFPIAYYYSIKSLNSSLGSVLIPALLISLIGFLDIRYVYLFGILLFVNFIYDLLISYKVRKLIINWIRLFVTILIVFVLLNFYWILIILIFEFPSLPTGYGDLKQLSFLSFGNILNSFTLQQPHWYLNTFGNISKVNPISLIVPIIILLTPIIVRKNKYLGFWVLIALVGIFLSKGNQSPIGIIYEILFSNVPGFSLFRDSTKFFVLISLSYSVIIAFFFSFIEKNKRHYRLITICFITYILFITRPVWTDKMTGILSKPLNESEYFEQSNEFQMDSDYSRILWIPNRPPIGYSSSNHPTLEASRLSSLRPFASGIVGSYEIFNFLRDAPYMGEILDVSSVGYIAYPFPDERRSKLSEDEKEYYDYFSDQIESLQWISEKISNKPLNVFRTKSNQDKVFVASNSFYVVGSDRIYNELIGLKDFKLSNNAVIFAEEEPEVINKYQIGDKIILYNKNIEDLKIAFVNRSDYYFPASDLGHDPDQSGWWKRNTSDLINWRVFLQEKYGIDSLDFDYGGGWAVAEGELRRDFISKSFNAGDYIFIRSLNSTKSGKLDVYQGDSHIGTITTKVEVPLTTSLAVNGTGPVEDKIYNYEEGLFNWQKVGQLVTDEKITIKSSGDINTIQSVVSITPEESAEIDSILSKINSNDLVDWKNSEIDRQPLFLTDSSPVIKFEEISPSKYIVKLSDINKPVTLVFASTYDENWQIGDQNSQRVYSLLNGFDIADNGEYLIEYAPQKYINYGLIVSISSFVILISLLVLQKARK